MNLSEADISYADLSGADLSHDANLRGAKLIWANLNSANLDWKADLTGAVLSNATLISAKLYGARLVGADLTKADLTEASLNGANLTHATLCGAILRKADLSDAHFVKANLTATDLTMANMVNTNLNDADLTGSAIFGASIWGLFLSKGTKQHDLIITPPHQSKITVDYIEVAQFIYLLLHNDKIHRIIDTITSKVVLILGRFTPERKASLDALREELRKRDYLPVLFDFEKPATRDLTETVSLLSRIARFVIADITEARSIPQELMAIVPNLPSVPIQPLLLEGSDEYGMFEHFVRYPWVLKTYIYKSSKELIANLHDRVVGPAEAKVRELRQ